MCPPCPFSTAVWIFSLRVQSVTGRWTHSPTEMLTWMSIQSEILFPNTMPELLYQGYLHLLSLIRLVAHSVSWTITIQRDTTWYYTILNDAMWCETIRCNTLYCPQGKMSWTPSATHISLPYWRIHNVCLLEWTAPHVPRPDGLIRHYTTHNMQKATRLNIRLQLTFEKQTETKALQQKSWVYSLQPRSAQLLPNMLLRLRGWSRLSNHFWVSGSVLSSSCSLIKVHLNTLNNITSPACVCVLVHVWMRGDCKALRFRQKSVSAAKKHVDVV